MEKLPTRSVSHKGEKVCSYTVDFKLEVVNYAEQSSIHAAGRKYNVSRSSVRDWKKKKVQLEDLRKSSGSGAHRRRLSGGGRKVFDSSTERSLIEWITERKQQGLTISGAMIIKKAKSLQQEKLHKQQLLDVELKQEGDGDPDGEHTSPESSSSQKKVANNRLTYSRGWLEKFMNRNGLALKNFPTYKGSSTSAEEHKIEINEPTPTVIPLDDLLPGELSENVTFMSRDICDDRTFTSSGICDEKTYICREMCDDADSYADREIRNDSSFSSRDSHDDSYTGMEIREDRSFTTRNLHSSGSFASRELSENEPYKTRELREDASFLTREEHHEPPYAIRKSHEEEIYIKRELPDDRPFRMRNLREAASFTSRGIRDDRSFMSRDLREDSTYHSPREITPPSDKHIDDLHDIRSCKSSPMEIQKYGDNRKSRLLDTKKYTDTPIRRTFGQTRHIHPPSVISIDDAYRRSTPFNRIPKVEPNDNYGYPSSSSFYPKGPPITTYHLTRVGDTYMRHSIPCNTFYKQKPELPYSGISNTTNYHKPRGIHTYSYSSPNTSLHKSRLPNSLTTVQKTHHNPSTDESFRYTSPNTTYIKTRIDGSTYTFASSSAFHKSSRDMQNPIVIPLDDILPE